MKKGYKNPIRKRYPGTPVSTGVSKEQGAADAAAQRLPQQFQRHRFLFFELLGVLLIALAFAFDAPADIWRGFVKIITSPANLLTDYIQLANTGAALMNVGLVTLFSVGLLRVNRMPVSGSIIAAVFTMAGFAFFGKNLYNTLPVILGVYAYSKIAGQPFGEYILHSMFGTALSPLVSEFSFNLGLSVPLGIVLGVAAGLLAGLVIVPFSLRVLQFHKGFSLYNIGFTAGIIGMFFIAVLRGFGIEVSAVSILSSGHNTEFAILLYGLFSVLLLLGLWTNRWKFKGLKRLVHEPGVLPADFITIAGLGPTLMNMALLGIVSVTYVLALGSELNGPVIGGIFTVVGFGAYGKHIKNVLPILIGVTLANFMNIHDISASFAVIAALFGTTLAPIAGRYGAVAGILAGFLHMSLVTNIGFLHAGVNLYNNGFSGGFVAAFLCPLLDTAERIRYARKQQ